MLDIVVLAARSNNGNTRKYARLGGRLIGESVNGVRRAIQTDVIGSVRQKTDAMGVLVHEDVRAPYGSTLLGRSYQNGPAFTGHMEDGATGLTYMKARYYDPVAMRFISPDPVYVDLGTGGNFNRYWYANNNPYTYVDPDGRQAGCGTRVQGGATSHCSSSGGSDSSSFGSQVCSTIRNVLTLAEHNAHSKTPASDGVDPTGRSVYEETSERLVEEAVDVASTTITVYTAASAPLLGRVAQVGRVVSQKQYRHIFGRNEYRGGGYLNSMDDAQAVLNSYLSGTAQVLGWTRQGFPVVRAEGVTGTNVNVGAGFAAQPTNVFIIKGFQRPSVVPTTPSYLPRP